MTDTPLDLDAIDARARAAANAPWGNAREHVCRNDVPALVAALRKAEAQVAAVLLWGGAVSVVLIVGGCWLVWRAWFA